MKNLIVILFLFNCVATTAFADNPSSTNLSNTTYSTKAQTSDEILAKQVHQAFDEYLNAQDNIMLYACTEKLANYQGISLSPNFYKQEQQYSQIFNNEQRDFNNTLSEAKQRFGREVGQTVNEVFQSQQQMPDIIADTVTRGYCRNYGADFAQKISDNLNKYRSDEQQTKHNYSIENNAVYLNSKFQIMNMPAQFTQQKSPSKVIIDTKVYPVKCAYQNIQIYDEAISTNSSFTEDSYKASQYFFQNYSPQIDYILTCKSNDSITKNIVTKISDTYPWYQPIVTGSKNEPAAGDAMIYLNNNNVTIILGHEPCVCNRNTEQQCNKIKDFSRGYKKVSWQLFASLDKEKVRHNAQAKQAINDYLIYGKNEIRKDFCFIDKEAMKNNLYTMIDKVKKAEPNGVGK